VSVAFQFLVDLPEFILLAFTLFLPTCRPVERTAKRTGEFLLEQELRKRFRGVIFHFANISVLVV